MKENIIWFTILALMTTVPLPLYSSVQRATDTEADKTHIVCLLTKTR